jgi:hypothetical protein
MSYFRHLWNQYATTALVALALIAGLYWGLNLGRELGRAETKSMPTPFPAVATSTPYPTATLYPTPTPTGEYIAPHGKLTLELETPPPDMTPPAAPQFRVRLDIRDTLTEQPVRASVWIVENGRDRLIADDISLIEFALPGKEGTATIKVQAQGYKLWALGFNYKAKYDRLLPVPVKLQRAEPAGDGA